MSDAGEGYFGWAGLSSATSQFNANSFLVKQILGTIRTATIVQVKAQYGGGIASVGTVDVLPLVNLTDGAFNVSQHGIVSGLPYFRLQGGANAIIIDPVVGDIGLAVFADRDISTVKASKAQGPPGSRRRFSFADGIYIGGILNGEPTQYVQFASTGINITDKNGNTIVMVSSGIEINGVLFDRSQNITLVEEITNVAGHTLTQHTHTQGNDSHGDTEVATNKPTG